MPCWVLLRRRRECLDPVHCRKLPAQCSTYQLLCPAGFFCVVGTSDFISSACQAGYYCLAGVQIPVWHLQPQNKQSDNNGLHSLQGNTAMLRPEFSLRTVYSWVCLNSAVLGTPAVPAQSYQCGVGTYCPTFLSTVTVASTVVPQVWAPPPITVTQGTTVCTTPVCRTPQMAPRELSA